jgi:hypothetical protein
MDTTFTAAFKQRIFTIRDEDAFNAAALDLFHYQRLHVTPYQSFLNALGTDAASVNHYTGIPCIPVEMFRNHILCDGPVNPYGVVFSSSGTTGQITSKHFVRDTELYRQSALTCFRKFYGEPSEYAILALLPSYLERSGSSLVYMMEDLIKRSGHAQSGFYLRHQDALPEVLQQLQRSDKKVFLLGVTYALLDLAALGPFDLSGCIVVETGGMKGTRREMIREEIHEVLKKAFNISAVHSEYGMTELLSQAWSSGNGYFESPSWMRMVIRDTYDPLAIAPRGMINVIDLANVHSCAFLATRDLGRSEKNGFVMLGRADGSELRGCNLMLG